MANVKITDLTEDTNPAGGDWIETVDISAGSSKKVTRANFLANISTATTAIANPYKFSVYRNASQTVSAATATRVGFDTENFDTNGNFDSTVSQGRYTAPVDGFYFFNGRVENNGNNILLTYLYKNGSEVRRGNQLVIATGLSGSVVCDLLQLTAGDYVEVWVYSDNTGINGGANKTFFSGFLVSKT